MKLNLLVYQRMLFTYAAILGAVALVLAAGVIEPVRAEAALGATPEEAVYAFLVNIGFNILSAVILVFIAMRSKGRGWFSTSANMVVGLVVLFLGIALADAASAYQSHGPLMQTASTLLFLCAAADFLAGVLIVTTAFLRPKKKA